MLFAIGVGCFLIPAAHAGPESVQASTELIRRITLKEDWSVKEIKQVATKLTAIHGQNETRLVSIGFPDEDSIKIDLLVYGKDRTKDEPVGRWTITLKRNKGVYVYVTHACGDV